TLLLSTGELTDLAVREIGHSDALEALSDDLALLFSGPSQEPQVAVASHKHHDQSVRGKVPIDRFPLRHVTDQFSLCLVRLPMDLDPTGGGGDEAQDPL